MNVSGISNSSDYQQVCNGRSKERTSAPVSFGYGEDSYTSSVAASYIQKQQQEKAQQALAQKKKDQWRQFGWDVLKGITIGGSLLLLAYLGLAKTKGGKEIMQSCSSNNTELASVDFGDKIKDTYYKTNVSSKEVLANIEKMPITSQARQACTNALISANASTRSSIKCFQKATSSGILLYGLPGVGKSYSARKFVEAFGGKYVELDVNSFKSAYVGESTKNIDRQILPIINEAKEHPDTPYFIIMDEADALLADTNDSSGTNNEMRSIFLQRMDAAQLPPNVKYILTTNFPEKITAAAVRTGRLKSIKTNNPSYDNLKNIYKSFLEDTYGDQIKDKDLEYIINMIPDRYGLLGPAHTKAVSEALGSILLQKTESEQMSYKFTLEELKEAFKSAHNTAISEYSARCNQVKPSETTSYDIDPNNIAFTKNIAKVCLLKMGKKELAENKTTINLLANNVPCELMSKVIASINGDTITKDNIDIAITKLATDGFNINKTIEDMQQRIDELAEEQENQSKQTS